jgi:hypothetical protein
MCVVSMVHDFYEPRIPRQWGDYQQPTITITPQLPTAAEVAELRQLIKDFREAVEAAKRIDALTNQPDCVDPEKAKLEERVAALERRLEGLRSL